jgi:hypothetical protein
VHDAIVFCLWCVARLCLHCDAAVHVHRAAALHPRARLCDACGDAPAVVRCDGTVTLCAVCVGRGAPGVTRTGVATYTGCPGPAEMARLISVDPPQPQQDLEAWLADKLEDDDEQDHQLPPDWDVAMETARLEKMLADSCYTSSQPEVIINKCIIVNWLMHEWLVIIKIKIIGSHHPLMAMAMAMATISSSSPRRRRATVSNSINKPLLCSRLGRTTMTPDSLSVAACCRRPQVSCSSSRLHPSHRR